MRFMLQRLREKQLHAKFSKYEFWLDIVAFLEHIVSVDGILVDSNKVKFLLEWQRVKLVHKVRSFLGLIGYYTQFVKGFAKLD